MKEVPWKGTGTMTTTAIAAAACSNTHWIEPVLRRIMIWNECLFTYVTIHTIPTLHVQSTLQVHGNIKKQCWLALLYDYIGQTKFPRQSAPARQPALAQNVGKCETWRSFFSRSLSLVVLFSVCVVPMYGFALFASTRFIVCNLHRIEMAHLILSNCSVCVLRSLWTNLDTTDSCTVHTHTRRTRYRQHVHTAPSLIELFSCKLFSV